MAAKVVRPIEWGGRIALGLYFSIGGASWFALLDQKD